MSHIENPFQQASVRRTDSGRRRAASCSAIALLFAAACQDPAGPGSGGGATLSGTVRVNGTAQVLDGAKITLGAKQATTDASGHFELTGVPVGSATVKAERPGFLPKEATVSLAEGSNSHDFTLSAQETYVTGGDAAYVPAGVGPLRGVIMVLGGPPTNGFVTGQRIAPVGKDELETSLQNLAVSLRSLARSTRMALIGRTAIGLIDNAGSDQLLSDLIRNVAALSGHAELSEAPVLLFTLSGGAREAGGFAARQPNRTIGLLARVPAAATSVSGAAALGVPTLMIQGELDTQVDNAAVRLAFLENRSRGGLWSLAVEPGGVHDVATNVANSATVTWISDVLALRLPATTGGPLTPVTESTGWLGNQTTQAISSWATYTGDRATASWFPSQALAATWQQLWAAMGSGLRIDPTLAPRR